MEKISIQEIAGQTSGNTTISRGGKDDDRGIFYEVCFFVLAAAPVIAADSDNSASLLPATVRAHPWSLPARFLCRHPGPLLNTG